VSLGNGREELAFPAPAKTLQEDFVISMRDLQATCHRLPREGSFLPASTTMEVRRRAASARDAIKQVARDEQTSRKPSDAPRSGVSDLGADTVGLHQDR